MVVGGGLIGAWICSELETAFRLTVTVTGTETTVVQVRFDSLLDNFVCPAPESEG